MTSQGVKAVVVGQQEENVGPAFHHDHRVWHFLSHRQAPLGGPTRSWRALTGWQISATVDQKCRRVSDTDRRALRGYP